MTELRRQISKAYPNDKARGIARLDPDTLLELKLSPGDFIELEGDDRTTAKVWRADRQDWHTETIRLDAYTRHNAGVDIDESVKVRKTRPSEASRIVLAPTRALLHLSGEVTDAVGQALLKRPVLESDLVAVQVGAGQPGLRAPQRILPLVAVETDPDDFVLVTADTDVSVRESPAETEFVGRQRGDAAHKVSVVADTVTLISHGLTTTGPILSDGPLAAVEGQLRNDCDNQLDWVEVAVTFYEDDEATVHLHHETVRTQQLKPGNVWPFRVPLEIEYDGSPRCYELVVEAG